MELEHRSARPQPISLQGAGDLNVPLMKMPALRRTSQDFEAMGMRPFLVDTVPRPDPSAREHLPFSGAESNLVQPISVVRVSLNHPSKQETLN